MSFRCSTKPINKSCAFVILDAVLSTASKTHKCTWYLVLHLKLTNAHDLFVSSERLIIAFFHDHHDSNLYCLFKQFHPMD